MVVELVDPPDSVARVARLPDPFEWLPAPPPMPPPPEPPGGYRWDDPEGKFATLYVATEPAGAFLETIQDFAPKVDLAARVASATDPADGVIPSPGIPE